MFVSASTECYPELPLVDAIVDSPVKPDFSILKGFPVDHQEAFLDVLRAAKQTLDPNGILTPGVLFSRKR